MKSYKLIWSNGGNGGVMSVFDTDHSFFCQIYFRISFELFSFEI